MRIVADVNVSPRVVASLRRAGFTVERVGEILDARAPDPIVLAHAERTGAVVVSRDQDFSALLAASGAAKPSLVNLRVTDVDPERLAQSKPSGIGV